MSNIYIQEPPTEGKVLLTTTAGDIDIELWSKEAPKACRNFIQLCLEKYYDNTIFHRVIPNFIVQGGDPTGTGMGGESVYGKPFKDEFHSRLRFVRRGLVAMANSQPNDNGSQFFITLAPCPELQNKHTIFGKVTGNTIYNLPRFEEGEIGKDDRPEFPHKIITTEVLKTPFTDIVPREDTRIENEVVRESKKTKGKKNFKLLSFGDEAEEDEEELVHVTKSMPNKSNSAHDIAKDPTLSSSVEDMNAQKNELERIKEKLKKENEKFTQLVDMKDEEVVDDSAEDASNKNKRKSELKAEIRKLKRELLGNSTESENNDQDDERETKKSKKENVVLKQYYEDIAKYEETRKVMPKKGASRESQTLLLLQRFTNKVKDVSTADVDEENSIEEEEEETDENDDSWLKHRLQFDDREPVLAKDASTKSDDWYDITDPRNALNKRRRKELGSKGT